MMKKIALLLIAIGAFYLFCSASSPLEEETIIREQMTESGVGQLFTLLPEDSREWFLQEDEPLSYERLTPQNIFSWIVEKGKDRLSFPLRLLTTLTGILLLSSLCGSLGAGADEKDNRSVFLFVSTLAVCGALTTMLTGQITDFTATVGKLSDFMLSFIPIFAGVAAAAGRPVSALGYQAVVFGVIQLFSAALKHLLIPMLGLFLAVCMTGAVTDVIKIDDAAKAMKKTILWTLSFFMTIFVGLLTVRGFGGSAADTVANRAAKFAIGTFVPVVGSALSDAYASLSACLGVVRNTVGIIGVLGIAFGFLPILIELSLTLGSVQIAGVLAQTLEQKRPADLLKAVGSALSVLLGIMIFYGMMMIVSITIMLMLGTGG